MAGPDPVTREEIDALRQRIDALEREVYHVRRQHAPVAPPVAPPPMPPPMPPRAMPPPAPWVAPKPAIAMETLLGERLAPRVGAVLVFLAALFFLGVGIQRGWIGPLLQLGIATLGAAALFAAGAYLASKRGYGRYPQILEGTGACVLYATAFVAERVDYYQRETGLSEAGGWALLALVAAGTVALAVWRDSRVIAGLGFALSFGAAALDAAAFPTLTVAYVALLGAALAGLVWRKGWGLEALAGTLVTGAFFVWFGYDAASADGPPAALVTVLALATAGAYFALAVTPRGDRPQPAFPFVAAVTLAWVALATVLPEVDSDRALGSGLLLWTAVAVALSVFARERGAHGDVVAVLGVGAVVLHVAWPFWLIEGETTLQVTLWCATALLVALLHRTMPTTAGGVWYGGVALAAVAALQAGADDGYGLTSTVDSEAALQAVFVVVALLALHHVRDPGRVKVDGAVLGGLLVGGSAAVVAVLAMAQLEGPTVSVLLGVTGVAYLVAGFILAEEKPYRYTGFAMLGFVVLRVFAVDLENTDLVVRALVFLLLGGILLGVGYAYARMGRAKAAAAEPRPPTPPAP